MIPYFISNKPEERILRTSISWEGKERVYKIPSPSGNVFRGKIYVLVNGRTYSNGHTLARYLKEFADAIIIGEETGTRYEGLAAGSSQYVILEGSGVRIGIPRYQYKFPVSSIQDTSNRGLIPDKEVTYSIQDLISKLDLHLKIAEEMIQRDQ